MLHTHNHKQKNYWQIPLFVVLSFGLSACVSINTGQDANKAQTTPPKKEVTVREKSISLDEAANFNMTLGAQYLKQNNFSQAIAKLEKAVEQQPDLALAHTYLAFAYERYDEFELSEKHYSRAVKLAPNDPVALNNYGTFLCRQNKLKNSLKYFERAVKNKRYQTPDAAMNNAGLCAKRIPDYQLADKYFRKAVNFNPRQVGNYYHLTEVNIELNKLIEAQEFFASYELKTADKQENPDYLFLAYRLNKALNKPGEAGRFALKLQQKFPNSAQTKKLLERRK